jgi:hypothetical protein
MQFLRIGDNSITMWLEGKGWLMFEFDVSLWLKVTDIYGNWL